MGIDDCFQLGHIVKTHGLHGEVSIHLDVDVPEEYTEMESVFVEQSGKLVPFFIESLSLQGDRGLCKFEEIDTIEQAQGLAGSSLYLPESLLPALPHGKYYYHQLVGADIFENGKLLGKITQIFKPSSQYLAALDYQGQEVLIPIEDSIFTAVDVQTGRIDVTLPEGLLDVFLSPE
ncbi:MAG: ribosome maturation factor RimM [Cyclobacteriaceae bacterium]|nr:ribosome maturation factor RimM [Cyclobacteriaceae bacterium]